MLEQLVSSRIRRALLEHILLQPQDRFYLRGLARTLRLSVTPLRRELKRLERAGMLKVIPEGNIIFYAVDPTSPTYLKLKSLSVPAVEPAAPAATPMAAEPALMPQPTPQPARRVNRLASLLGAAAIAAIAVGLSTVITNHRLLSHVARAWSVQKTDVTVVIPAQSASGVMRGAKWQIVPGGVGGGFSTATNSEAY